MQFPYFGANQFSAFVKRTMRPHIFLWLLGAVACSYALGVLVYALFMPDLGMKSIFSSALKHVHKDSLGKYDRQPKRDDIVREVGEIKIESWPDLLNSPLRAQRLIESSNSKLDWAKFDKGTNSYFVKVKLERPTAPAGDKVFYAWFRLGKLPLSELAPSLLWFFLKLLLFTVGVLVLWKRPDDPASVRFYVLCVVTLGAYIGGYHWIHVATSPELIIGFIIFSVLVPPVTLHFYLVFPRPKSFLQKHRIWPLIAVYGFPVLILAALVTEYLYYRGLYLEYHARVASLSVESAQNLLLGIESAQNLFLGTIYVSLVSASVWYLASTAALVHSWFRARDVMERNQVICILIGAGLSLFPIGYSLYLALFDPNTFGAGGATWPMFLASLIVTAAFIVSITRYRLMELDQIISSGAVYFLISFLVGLSYYAVVFVGTLILFNQVIADYVLADALKVSSVALVLMLVLDLVRNRFKKVLDRRFHREKYHLDRTLQRMGEAVQQLVDPATLLQKLLHSLSDLLGVARGAVYLCDDEKDCYRLVGWVGPAPARAEIATDSPLPSALVQKHAVRTGPRSTEADDAAGEHLQELGGGVAYALTCNSRLSAFLVLGPKATGAYRSEDLDLLGAFAKIAVLALSSGEGRHAIEQLNLDLHGKVEKIAEQQRRIYALQTQLRRQEFSRRSSFTPNATTARANSRKTGPEDLDGNNIATLCPNIVGSGPEVKRLLKMVQKVAQTDAVVLIRGESGTGKELLAEALHRCSPRSDKALVKVHCAALSPTLLESELFGHVKGAFTGAHRDKAGRFETAHGGTLFLDEIADISPEVQTKLLRVLQERTIERVGSNETIKVDVRIVTATHQNLEELIRQGRLREDLYYRLNVFPVFVPPLRQRREDIAELTLHFLDQAGQRCGKSELDIDEDAMAALKAYDWPGNIRQLENVIERAAVLVEGATVHLADLPEEVRIAWGESENSLPVEPTNGVPATTEPDHRRRRVERQRLERERILQALAAAGGNRAQAARNLGLARSTLVSRLKKYGVL